MVGRGSGTILFTGGAVRGTGKDIEKAREDVKQRVGDAAQRPAPSSDGSAPDVGPTSQRSSTESRVASPVASAMTGPPSGSHSELDAIDAALQRGERAAPRVRLAEILSRLDSEGTLDERVVAHMLMARLHDKSGSSSLAERT